MVERLILLPGWGLGCAPLQPLVDALGPGLQVDIEPLPLLEHGQLEWCLDRLDERLPRGAWLGGWSLGGMLACLLAARRATDCPGLLTLASNASFVTRDDWPAAMPVSTFEAFYSSYRQHPTATLKRFAMLCSQGATDARGLSRTLLAQAGGDSLAGLDLLATLDTRSALSQFEGPQLHLFASADALVPAGAAAAVQAVQPAAAVRSVEGASHAVVMERPGQVAALLLGFMEAQRGRAA
ncbi:pimeloyl-[acyl-carrier protein] methyl ester esterase [Pseudomonas flavescens]|uniref:Pimeloyl-[acyl-carrier protein] methyl ester esterase n=1 Tax=Phytopseudomonas flavescens TaxID=29435 RepID=A0A1G8FZB7_9GAMM|nr:alpha/beta fold hydrolase [Pseudomonas flavescens]SDH87455.1 pimeloyl-[acyl-carrier protein] methyl ester esterase [Pseudomonas flavescens]